MNDATPTIRPSGVDIVTSHLPVMSAARTGRRGTLTNELRQWHGMLKEHFSDDNIWPDLSYADLSNPKCFANTMILHELIDRSIKKEDLYEGLPDIFRAALKLHPKFIKEGKRSEERRVGKECRPWW